MAASATHKFISTTVRAERSFSQNHHVTATVASVPVRDSAQPITEIHEITCLWWSLSLVTETCGSKSGLLRANGWQQQTRYRGSIGHMFRAIEGLGAGHTTLHGSQANAL